MEVLLRYWPIAGTMIGLIITMAGMWIKMQGAIETQREALESLRDIQTQVNNNLQQQINKNFEQFQEHHKNAAVRYESFHEIQATFAAAVTKRMDQIYDVLMSLKK